MTRTSELRALVSLLGDDDPSVAGMIWDNLRKLGAEAFPVLREATEDADPRLRVRARAVLDRLVFDAVQTDLRRAVGATDASFDLEGALTALARLETADLAADRVSRSLDELAARITPRLARLHHPLDRVGAINTLLFGEQHFTLVYRSQAELRHFCLPLVLEARAGAPALLVAIYLLLADRIELPLRVVWLPSHECLRLESGGQEIYVEPGRSGRILSRRELIQTCLRDYHHNDSYIREGSRRDVVVRAVRGMMLLGARTRDWARSEKLGKVLGILQGGEKSNDRPHERPNERPGDRRRSEDSED